MVQATFQEIYFAFWLHAISRNLIRTYCCTDEVFQKAHFCGRTNNFKKGEKMEIIPTEVLFSQKCSIVGTNERTESPHPFNGRNMIHGGQNVLIIAFFQYNSLNRHYFEKSFKQKLKIIKFSTKKVLIVFPLRPCLLYTSPSPRDRTRSRMPSSA